MDACRMPDLGYIEFHMHRMQHGLFVFVLHGCLLLFFQLQLASGFFYL